MAPGCIARAAPRPASRVRRRWRTAPRADARATCSWSRPMPAARPARPAPAARPAQHDVRRACTSSPLRRIHWPGAGTRRMRTRPSPARLRVSSCITIASAPAGTGAPVKMRAAVPGCSGCAAAAGGNALADRQRHAFVGDLGAAHRIAVHRAVVLRRHLQGRDQVLRQHAAVGVEGGHRLRRRPAAAPVPAASARASSSGRSGGRAAGIGSSWQVRGPVLMRISPGRSRSGPHCRPATAPPRPGRSDPAPAAGSARATGRANRWRWRR